MSYQLPSSWRFQYSSCWAQRLQTQRFVRWRDEIVENQLVNYFFTAFLLNFLFSFCVSVNLIFVAAKWENYMKFWSKVDSTFKASSIFDSSSDLSLRNFKILRWFYGFLLLAFFNYVVFMLRGILSTNPCSDGSQTTTANESFFRKIFPEFFNVFSFNIAFGIFLLIIDFIMGIIWVISDTLIITISLLLSENFAALNEKIAANLLVKISSLWFVGNWFEVHFSEQVSSFMVEQDWSIQVANQTRE